MAQCIQCGEKAGLGMSLCTSCLVENARKQLTPEELSSVSQQQYAGRTQATSVSTIKAILDTTSPRVSALAGRYRNAYLVAKLTVGLGGIIKVIGFVLGGVILLGTFLFASYVGSQGGVGGGGGFLVSLFIGGVNAFVVGFVFYIIGVIVTAMGQTLKAILDNTVGNSPFLENEQKAAIMSLPA